MKKIGLILIACLGMGSLAQAGVIFEPYLGYDMGSQKSSYPDGSSTKQDLSAIDGGLRLGLRHMGLWIAADGDFGFSGKSKPQTGESSDFTSTTVLVDVGYDFMSRLRLYAGVGVMDSVELKDSTGTKTTFYNGNPLKVGLGYWLHPHVCLNLEYRSHDYKKVKGTGYDESLSDAGLSSVKTSIYTINLSFPL